MQSTLKSIEDQIELCVALMSDPFFLRRQPAAVAAQIDTVFLKVEELGVFLNPPAKSDCSHQRPWLDRSILEAGIKPMVVQILQRLMSPLRLEKFPKVFEVDLRPRTLAPDAEHPVECEIRQANCMGAMVVLYYYILWYAHLIVINFKEHPWCGNGEDYGELLDAFIRRIPNGNQMLEKRILSGDFNQEQKTALAGCRVVELFRFDEVWAGRKRDTNIVCAYRLVLEFLTGNEEQYTPRLVGLLNALLASTLIEKAELFGGVLSTVDWADGVAKWQDMYQDTEVQSNQQNENERAHALYTCKLAKILKQTPYNDGAGFVSAAKQLAIYDYASLGIMVDLCKSAIALRLAFRRVLRNNSNETIEAVVVQACGQHDGLLDVPALRNVDPPPQNVYYDSGLVADTVSRMRPAATLPAGVDLTGYLWVDNVLGYYWGSRYSDKTNHAYLAWTGLQVDLDADASPMDRVQFICNTVNESHEGRDEPTRKSTRNVVIALLLTPAQRNSLLVESILRSATRLQEKVKCKAAIQIQLQRQNIVTFENTDSYLTSLQTIYGFRHQPVPEMADLQFNRPEHQHITLTQAIDRLKAEHEAFLAYVQRLKIKQFTKYVGISWPVRIGDEASNYQQWRLVRTIPARTVSLAESAMSVATSASSVARDVHILARRAPQ